MLDGHGQTTPQSGSVNGVKRVAVKMANPTVFQGLATREVGQGPSRSLITRLLGFCLLLMAGVGVAACGQAKPNPPARNVFYEVKRVSVSADQPDPVPDTVDGNVFVVAMADDRLLDDKLEASWSINWNCMSDHCEFEQCVGTAYSHVRDVLDNRWLEVDRRIDWNKECGKPASWLSQVDRYSGQERYPSQDALFQFWAGAKAATAQEALTLGDGRQVQVWCTGPQKAEVVEKDGWMSLYDGEVCYDVRTGILVFMSYMKRWVFTGLFDGKSYERADFGDSETYEQLLETTNAQLSFVKE